jgi:hypothetical protein
LFRFTAQKELHSGRAAIDSYDKTRRVKYQ